MNDGIASLLSFRRTREQLITSFDFTWIDTALPIEGADESDEVPERQFAGDGFANFFGAHL
jgi:hypothetical protein